MGGMVSRTVSDVKAEVKSQVDHRIMIQREVQMAVNIAKARDALQWYGGLYTIGCTGATIAGIAGKLPKVAMVPIVVGGFMITNMADLAYGNKLLRVQREAERIIKEERAFFVPPDQAPFAYLYEPEKSLVSDISTVSALWPPFLPWSSAVVAATSSDVAPKSE
mmetsp:Transcript_6137/g.15688  ORF Transcript_6137/g.15688 Transcript_6137/m.15688 type:complete len:164 (-) Transcript_6137:1663-2154(-)